MSENRDFKGVWIPKSVWLDTRLNALDKVILIEIDSLDNGERGCYASNEHLAEFCQCSKTKVSTAITKLIKCGYLYVQSFNGRQRELKSRLSNSERQTYESCKADVQNLKESNIDNNTDNNTVRKKAAKPRAHFVEPTLEDVKAYCEERRNGIDAQHFIDYYSARGWELSKGRKVKDWKACVRTWENNSYNRKPTKQAEKPQQKPKEINVDDFRRADGTIDCDAYMRAQYS